jgi:hypothetical protein
MNLLQTTHFVREFWRGIFDYCLSITAGLWRTLVKKHTYGVEGETKPENVLVSFLFFTSTYNNLCTKERAEPRGLILPGKHNTLLVL